MRRTLLASAAILGATGGLAVAQQAIPPTGASPNQLQGQYTAPLLGGPAANNNLNAFGTAIPGAAVAPTPGAVVIRLNGKVYTEFDVSGGSSQLVAAGTISAGQQTAGKAVTNAVGYKLNPVGLGAYFRLYPGIDAMATNGMRYGAGVEIRENFVGGNNFQVSSGLSTTATGTQSVSTTLPSGTAISGTASGAAGVSSAQTLYVRRAFVYMGSDQLGIIRLGQADGLPGIYDATGIFTVGSWDGGIGNLLNAGVQAVTPNENLLSWAFLGGNGQEYDTLKAVYLSPSFFGVDLGIEFSPSQGNIFSDVSTTSSYQVNPCSTASANCVSVTSGSDSSRWINRWGFGGRFIESFGGATVQGFGTWVLSGTAKNPLAVPANPTTLKATPAVSGIISPGGPTAANIKYDGQNIFIGALAATYMGVTANVDVSYGRANGTNALAPTGGAPEIGVIGGLSYAVGQFAFGADYAVVTSQGNVELTHTSQRHEIAFAVGGVYKVAPGLNLCLEYQYGAKHQGGYNFDTGAAGVPTENNIHIQGLTFAAIMNW
jgi:hypothetical protein